MFLQSGYSGAARARYQAVDVSSQVEGASPHQLVGILFDQLIQSIDTMLAAQRAGNRAKMIERQSKASMILITLETTLDYQAGGDLAINLALVYREGRRLIQLGGRTSTPEPVEEARAMLSEIVDAWRTIA
jgi:flagellar protein FliS